jgi:hypothetical protein
VRATATGKGRKEASEVGVRAVTRTYACVCCVSCGHHFWIVIRLESSAASRQERLMDDLEAHKREEASRQEDRWSSCVGPALYSVESLEVKQSQASMSQQHLLPLSCALLPILFHAFLDLVVPTTVPR